MSASFEVFCLASGIEAPSEMMAHDAQAACGGTFWRVLIPSAGGCLVCSTHRRVSVVNITGYRFQAQCSFSSDRPNTAPPTMFRRPPARAPQHRRKCSPPRQKHRRSRMREWAPRGEPAAGRVVRIIGQRVPAWNAAVRFGVFKDASPFEWRLAVTIRHVNDRHYDWKHIVDYETIWILAFSAVVLGSGIFALFSISQNNAVTLP
jgi:hypothetical protein